MFSRCEYYSSQMHRLTSYYLGLHIKLSRVGSTVVRIDSTLSVLSLSLGFLWLCVVLLTRDSFFVLCYFYVICVFCCLVVLVRLSVAVQVIDWKDSSLK